MACLEGRCDISDRVEWTVCNGRSSVFRYIAFRLPIVTDHFVAICCSAGCDRESTSWWRGKIQLSWHYIWLRGRRSILILIQGRVSYDSKPLAPLSCPLYATCIPLLHAVRGSLVSGRGCGASSRLSGVTGWNLSRSQDLKVDTDASP